LRALITGITGQDGAYLARLLQKKGYEVFGGYRRGASPRTDRLERLGVSCEMVPIELGEYENIKRTIDRVRPTEIYNLAAQSFVGDSFELPLYTVDVNGVGVLRLLEAIRGKNIRLYQASTSEMFGNAPARQNERSRFQPRSPYGAGKLLAHSLCVNYRDSYKTKVSCGILFNHESPLRGQEFVTQKIAKGVWNNKITLGNLEARRDWGHAADYVRAMWLMLQHDPDDFVIATGKSHTVKEFLNLACETAKRYPEIASSLDHYRPAEVHHLCGDATKAHEVLKWEPRIGFKQLVSEMVREAKTCTKSLSDMTARKSRPIMSAHTA